MADEVHFPTPDGPIERVEITYRRGADGVARVDSTWGRQIAAAAALIVQGDSGAAVIEAAVKRAIERHELNRRAVNLKESLGRRV